MENILERVRINVWQSGIMAFILGVGLMVLLRELPSYESGLAGVVFTFIVMSVGVALVTLTEAIMRGNKYKFIIPCLFLFEGFLLMGLIWCVEELNNFLLTNNARSAFLGAILVPITSLMVIFWLAISSYKQKHHISWRDLL